MNFDQAFVKLVNSDHEGGYVDDPEDPGGETNFGISKRSYPEEDIKNMTLERAKLLYKRDFWGPAGCDALPEVMKFQMFDLAVNTSARSKPTTAIKLLQMAVGANVDGQLGPKTLMAVQSMNPDKALRRLQGLALRRYASLANWPRFGRGWVNRLALNMIDA